MRFDRVRAAGSFAGRLLYRREGPKVLVKAAMNRMRAAADLQLFTFDGGSLVASCYGPWRSKLTPVTFRPGVEPACFL